MDIEEYAKKYQQFYKGEISQLLLKYLESEKWGKFLDLGCGDGSLLYKLNEECFFKNKDVYAIDLSSKRIGLVKRINKKFKCFIDDACEIRSINDSYIDFVVSNMVIEHVPSDGDMIKEIRRILKSGGLLYLSTVFKRWYGWYFYRCNGKWVLDPTHLREYTNDSQLLRILQKNNFDILENKKTQSTRSIINNLILSKISNNREITNNFIIGLLEKVKIPIIGYYKWEIVCRKG